MYTKEQWQELAKRFNEKSFLGKLVTIKANPEIFYLEVDSVNVELRLVNNDAMFLGYDDLFEFPDSFNFSHLRDIFSLIDINCKELK